VLRTGSISTGVTRWLLLGLLVFAITPAWAQGTRGDRAAAAVAAKAGDRAAFVGVFTTSSMREHIFYSPSSDWVEAFHHELMAAVSSHEVQCGAVRDPEWNVYRTFVQ